MTRDDIIRMAREAGLLQIIPDTVHWHGVDCIEAFAALVAAAERKTCEVACAQALEYARLAEREMCAKVAGRMFIRDSKNYPGAIADAIRARST